MKKILFLTDVDFFSLPASVQAEVKTLLFDLHSKVYGKYDLHTNLLNNPTMYVDLLNSFKKFRLDDIYSIVLLICGDSEHIDSQTKLLSKKLIENKVNICCYSFVTTQKNLDFKTTCDVLSKTSAGVVSLKEKLDKLVT